MNLDIKGHSGCSINVVREKDKLFVVKSTTDKMYFQRIIKQAEKQIEASQGNFENIKIPKVYDVIKSADFVSFKMDYVYSLNFIEYFESSGFEQIEFFTNVLISYVEKEIENSSLKKIPTSILQKKYYSVVKKINENHCLKNNSDIYNLLKKTEKEFDLFCESSYMEIPIGPCHGDLTFSNILFNGNNFYLIDFLDSFIESPLLDIVKIRQDTAFQWSKLMYTRSYDELRLQMVCEKIDREVQSYFQKYDWFRNYYVIFQLLNMFRILQYAKDDKVIDFLKQQIGSILEKKEEKPFKEEKIHDKTNLAEPFSLIVPVAADIEDGVIPDVFRMDKTGIMLCVKAILGLNLNVFDKVYFTVLKKHSEKFCVGELLKIQFMRFGLVNAQIVVLENMTTSQSETVYKTIKQENIHGGIFIKDGDCFFKGTVRKENGVAIFPLEKLQVVDPQHKSYVFVDDMYYVINIIEKKVIGHYFCSGGYCFEDAHIFCMLYEKLTHKSLNVCLSHIVYKMLLQKINFRPIEVEDYIDFGNKLLFDKYYE